MPLPGQWSKLKYPELSNSDEITGMIGFCDYPGQGPNSHKIQYVTESDKATLPEYDIIGNR